MMLEKLKDNRSHRSFTKNPVTTADMEKMIEGARVTGSTSNSQPVRFMLISSQEMCDKIFPLVKFAGAIPWNPVIDESPRGYIAMCAPKDITEAQKINFYFNMGLAAQSILLMANELGYHGCMIGAYDKKGFDEEVKIPEGYASQILISLGQSKDTVTIVEAKNKDTKYYRDDNGHHFVPKLSLDELIIKKI